MINMMDEIEVARRSWELHKYTDEELEQELYLRKKQENADKAELYKDKDVIDFDDITGEPFNSDTEGHLHQ